MVSVVACFNLDLGLETVAGVAWPSLGPGCSDHYSQLIINRKSELKLQPKDAFRWSYSDAVALSKMREKNVEMNFDRTTAIESLKNDSKLLWIMVTLVSSI